jgi:hypothetical protein
MHRPTPTEIPEGIVDFVDYDWATELYYGAPLSDFNFGFGLSVSLDNYKGPYMTKDAEEYKESARFIMVSTGISSEMMDLGLRIGLPSAKAEYTNNTDFERTWGGFGFGVTGRYFMEADHKTVVPAVVLHYGSGTEEDGDYEADHSEMLLTLGVVLEHMINDDNTLLLGIEPINYSSETKDVKDGTKTTETAMGVPSLIVGVESEITSWLTGRFGARETFNYEKTKVEPADGDETETSTFCSDFMYNMGIAIAVGDFTFDALFNESLLFEGPNFVTGGTADWVYKISMTYNY